MLIVLIDDVGLAHRAPLADLATPERRAVAKTGLKFNRFHTTAPLLAHASGAADRAQSPFGEHGGIVRSRLRPRFYPRYCRRTGAARYDAQAEAATRRRSSASATKFRSGRRARWDRSTNGPPARRIEYFYGSSAGSRQYYPVLYEGTSPDRTGQDTRGWLPLTEDMTTSGRLDPPAEVLMPDKPFFIYFAPGATHCAAPRAEGLIDNTRASSTADGTSSAKRLCAQKTWA